MSTRVEEYQHAPEVEGIIVYEKNWYLLEIPSSFHQMLIQQLEEEGEVCKPNKRPHVSVMKKEAASLNQEQWGMAFVGELVTVKYNPIIRNENGFHFWIDCYSPRLCEMREHFGLTTLKTRDGLYLVNFHMTIGRRKKAKEANFRPQYRLSPQSHIDVETFMQHL